MGLKDGTLQEDLFGMGGRKMEDKSLGFIGAGRIARILLGGLKRAGKLPSKIVVSDANEDILQKLKKGFPGNRCRSKRKSPGRKSGRGLCCASPASYGRYPR